MDFSRFLPPVRSDEASRRYQAEVDAEIAARRREERRKRLDAARDLRLTDEMYQALVDIEAMPLALIETESLVPARRFTSGAGRPVLILNGGTGCGKSLAAAWVLAQVGGVWLPAKRACRDFSANFGEQYDTQKLARDCALLVLDDVGAEDDPGRMAEVLTELLDARKSRRHRTVITTNLPKAKFEARYPNERMASRLCELAWWAGSKGPDLRRNPKGD